MAEASDATALPVPDDLKPLLSKHAGVDWGAVAWDAVRRRAVDLDRAETLARKSKLTAVHVRDLAAALRGPAA